MIVSLIVALLVVAVLLYVLAQLPLDPAVMNIIRALVLLLAVLYILAAFGVIDARWARWR